MPITTMDEAVDQELVTADQTDEGTPISIEMAVSWQEETPEEEEQEFTKADFERDLRKVSRRIK